MRLKLSSLGNTPYLFQSSRLKSALVITCLILIHANAPAAPEDNSLIETPPPEIVTPREEKPIGEFCQDQLGKIPSSKQLTKISQVCKSVQMIESCRSRNNQPIFHFEKEGEKGRQKIIAFALIHGDETESTTVAAAWMERLTNIQPRNTWRVIPIVNPDGWKNKTRTNANGVDINRNFPSKDWNDLAMKFWKEDAMGSARRFPGGEPGSEPETKCVMAQIEDFKPDFVISVHTPLGLLDFDGPKIGSPQFAPLPWVSLGNYPGSLGRYMWLDRRVPVLTVELKQRKDAVHKLEEFDKLQDLTGTVALQSEKQLRKPSATGKTVNLKINSKADQSSL